MKKVLIVSYYFPPLNCMASKRYGYMCKYLEDSGYEAKVLTARPRGGGYYLDAKLDLEVPLPVDKIYRIGALGIKYPIKEYPINLFLQRLREKNKFSRVIEPTSLGWYNKVKEEINLKQFEEIDIVIGTFPTIGNILVGEYISRKLNKPFIAEIRDLVSDYDEGHIKGKFEKKFEQFLEKLVLSKADGLVTVTSGFNKILTSRYPGKRVTTVYNGWEFTQAKSTKNLKKDYMYYAGSLYEHRVESIEHLLKILKKNNIKITVIIRSVGPENLNEKIKRIIHELAMEDQVMLKKAASESVVQVEQSEAKINLLISSLHKEDGALMTTLPGKLFEMINFDSPVLAIVDDSAEIGEVLKNTNKGIATSNERKIASFILRDYEHYVGNEKISDYSRKNQAKKLCKFLDITLGGTR